MADSSPATSIIEGTVKFRDGKKWKSRWCVMRKLSPVAGNPHMINNPQSPWKLINSAQLTYYATNLEISYQQLWKIDDVT